MCVCLLLLILKNANSFIPIIYNLFPYQYDVDTEMNAVSHKLFLKINKNGAQAEKTFVCLQAGKKKKKRRNLGNTNM